MARCLYSVDNGFFQSPVISRPTAHSVQGCGLHLFSPHCLVHCPLLGDLAGLIAPKVNEETNEAQYPDNYGAGVKDQRVFSTPSSQQVKRPVRECKGDDTAGKEQDHQRCVAESWITINHICERGNNDAEETVELHIRGDDNG